MQPKTVRLQIILAKLNSEKEENVTDAELHIHKLRAYILSINSKEDVPVQHEFLKLLLTSGSFNGKNPTSDETKIFNHYNNSFMKILNGNHLESRTWFKKGENAFSNFREKKWTQPARKEPAKHAKKSFYKIKT